MKKILSILCVFAIILSVFANTVTVSAHYDTAYWHETSSTFTAKQWMSKVDGSKRISELSIPGTHDSMAFKDNLMFIDNTRTQSMNLITQLNSGIRYIDIRAMYNSQRDLPLYHGIVYLGFNFKNALDTISKFLQDNPTETILMRFKQENSSASDRDMYTAFYQYYNQYRNIFWKPTSDNPTLNEVRGKVVLLSDVLSLDELGISYRKAKVQDDYHLTTNWDLYTKWTKIKNFATQNQSSTSNIRINYLTGSGGSMPYFVASGHSSPQTGANRLLTGLTEPAFSSYYPDFPRVGQVGALSSIAFEGTNTLFANLIENGTIKNTGIVVADFPGERLIKNIIYLNYGIGTSGDFNYFIHDTTSPQYVLDLNRETSFGVTLWSYNGGSNQKWKLNYDKQKDAYQIVPIDDTSKVLAWTGQKGNYQVNMQTNSKSSHQYWKIQEQGDCYVFKNYKDSSLYLYNRMFEGQGSTLGVIQFYSYSYTTFNIRVAP